MNLIAKLTPDYAPMARRLVVDNGWFDTLLRNNVELITEGIDHFSQTGIVAKDGVERDYDLVVLGAGFKVSQYLWPVDYIGRDDATLADLWDEDGARAYLTVASTGVSELLHAVWPQCRGSRRQLSFVDGGADALHMRLHRGDDRGR